jgi:Transposase DDE domain group 1
MIRQQRRRITRELKSIKMLSSSEKLSASTGLGVLVEMFAKSPFMHEIEKFLPERVSHRSLGSPLLALTLFAAHLMGAESVEDISELQDDEFLCGLFGGAVPAPRTIIDFLNDFEPAHIEGLNQFLNTMGKSLKSFLIEEHDKKMSKDRIIDIDSTYHIHYGELIEGAWWNYKKEWSLESQSAFSSEGFCHQVWLRPGNTKSGTDADLMIDNLFTDSKSQAERKYQGKDFTRMDSAFCNQNTIKSCMKNGLLFTITANKATTFWHHLLEEQGVDWKPWAWSESEQVRFAKTKTHPPQIELGRIWWRPSWSDGKLLFPIIVKRTWKSFCKVKDKNKKEQGLLFYPDSSEEQGGWDYYAVVTNHDLAKEPYQEVMVHHQARASSENMNKEIKYGYKLNNFPCRKIVANQAWYVFAMIAHNLLRFVSLMDNPENPYMSKKTRRKFINFPSKYIERSRQFWLKVPEIFYKGVIALIAGWQFPDRVSAHMFSTA